ncbi:MAG: methylated-DNA--[protein]-cysteine S-methyltransferase [Bdellovibrionota bacterium]
MYNRHGLLKIQLPEDNKLNTKNKLLENLFGKISKEASIFPKWFLNFEHKLNDYFEGKATDFSSVPLELDVTSFQYKVYTKLKLVPYGQLATYKDLAIQINSPKASRAIGMAMGKNPTPIVLPCHRIISSTPKSLGGFSAHGGLDTKRKLLHLEKIQF